MIPIIIPCFGGIFSNSPTKSRSRITSSNVSMCCNCRRPPSFPRCIKTLPLPRMVPSVRKKYPVKVVSKTQMSAPGSHVSVETSLETTTPWSTVFWRMIAGIWRVGPAAARSPGVLFFVNTNSSTFKIDTSLNDAWGELSKQSLIGNPSSNDSNGSAMTAVILWFSSSHRYTRTFS